MAQYKKTSKPGVLMEKDTFDTHLKESTQFNTFNPVEREYALAMWSRLVRIRDQYQMTHDELDGLTVAGWVEQNAKRANSYIEPRKNSSDIAIQSGITREKLLSIASHIHRLNLAPEVHSFKDDSEEDISLGRSFTNAIRKSRKLEEDDNKRLLRTMMLLEQGTCFVEEAWRPSTVTKKKIKNKAMLDPAKGFEGLEWLERNDTTYRAESNILSMKDVYLENIKQLDNDKQSRLFTIEIVPFDQAYEQYGGWKNWKYVKPGASTDFSENNNSVMYRDMTLLKKDNTEVEIIKYQDRFYDEYQIIINGVFMLPMGFPTPWAWDGFNIDWQVYEPISPFFALGKSLISKVDKDDALLTEFLRLFTHKTKQSVKPPAGNMTGKKLPSRIFDPGIMWNGLDATKIVPLINHQGVNPAEWQMFNAIKEFIDEKSVSRLAQGQQLSRSATATEILELQKQAQINLGLSLFSASQLERKMSDLRLKNILENWSRPISEEFDEAKQQLVKQFRSITMEDSNLGDREGTEKLVFTDEDIDFKKAYEMSKKFLTEERSGKSTVKTTVISNPILKRLKYTHHIQIVPTEQESDNLNKILFNEEFTQAANFFGVQSINMDFYKRKFAKVWGNSVDEAFSQASPQDMMSALQQNGSPEQIKKASGAGAGASGQAPSLSQSLRQ